MIKPNNSYVVRTGSAQPNDIESGTDLTDYANFTMEIIDPDGVAITLTNAAETTELGAVLSVGTTVLMEGEAVIAQANTYLNFNNVNMVDGSPVWVFSKPGQYRRRFTADNGPTDQWTSDTVCRFVINPDVCS